VIRYLLRLVERAPGTIWLGFGVAFAGVFLVWLLLRSPGDAGLLRHLMSSLFLAMQMVVMEVDVNEHADGLLGDQFTLTFLMAMSVLLPVLASAGLIRAFFYERLRPLLFRWAGSKARDHIVIVGAGKTGKALLEHYLGETNEPLVCVVERSGYSAYYQDLFRAVKDKSLLWIGSDATRNHSLSASAIGHPKRLYLVAGSDRNNLDVLDSLFAARKTDQSVSRMEVLVRLSNSVEREVLEASLSRMRKRDPDFARRFWVRSFSVEALAARNAFQRYWPADACRTGVASFLLVGDSGFSMEFVDQLARLGHFDVSGKTNLRWLVPPGASAPELAVARNAGLLVPLAGESDYEGILPVAGLDVRHAVLERLADHRVLQDLMDMNSRLPQRILVCTNDRELNVWLAQMFRRALLRKFSSGEISAADLGGCRIAAVVEQVEDTDLATNKKAESLLLRHWRIEDALDSEIETFEILQTAVGAISSDWVADFSAMFVSRIFNLLYSSKGKLPELPHDATGVLIKREMQKLFADGGDHQAVYSEQLRFHWSQSEDEERWSNRDTVDHALLKIAFVAAQFAKEVGDDSVRVKALSGLIRRIQSLGYPEGSCQRTDVSLPTWTEAEFDALMLELDSLLTKYSSEASGYALSRIEHCRWFAFKLAMGWRYGARDSAAKLNANMVEFSRLATSIQNIDTLFVVTIPSCLKIMWRCFPEWQSGQKGHK